MQASATATWVGFWLNQPTSPMPLIGLGRAMGIAKTVEGLRKLARIITVFVPETHVAPRRFQKVVEKESMMPSTTPPQTPIFSLSLLGRCGDRERIKVRAKALLLET
jgi:hypothetical protein